MNRDNELKRLDDLKEELLKGYYNSNRKAKKVLIWNLLIYFILFLMDICAIIMLMLS